MRWSRADRARTSAQDRRRRPRWRRWHRRSRGAGGRAQGAALRRCDPGWANGTGVHSADLPPTEAHFADYARFMERMATTFRGRVDAWQIWNEPNLPRFWRSTDAAAYGRLVSRTAPAIRAADPGALVVSAGLSPDGADPYPFVASAMAAGMAGDIDRLGLHVYPERTPERCRPRTDGRPVAKDLCAVGALVDEARRHQPGISAWITEIGWSNYDRPGWGNQASEAEQADYLTRAEARLATATGRRAGLLVRAPRPRARPGLVGRQPRARPVGLLAEAELYRVHLAQRLAGDAVPTAPPTTPMTPEPLGSSVSPVASPHRMGASAPLAARRRVAAGVDRRTRGVRRCLGRRATIVGTRGDDHLRGTPRADVVVALGGDDVVVGFGGDDRICAGAGADRVHAGAGHDRIRAGGGADRVYGGAGRDILIGGGGGDRLFGGEWTRPPARRAPSRPARRRAREGPRPGWRRCGRLRRGGRALLLSRAARPDRSGPEAGPCASRSAGPRGRASARSTQPLRGPRTMTRIARKPAILDGRATTGPRPNHARRPSGRQRPRQ